MFTAPRPLLCLEDVKRIPRANISIVDISYKLECGGTPLLCGHLLKTFQLLFELGRRFHEYFYLPFTNVSHSRYLGFSPRVIFLNSSDICFVTGPNGDFIGLSLMEAMGVTSAAVPVKKHSSAAKASAGVMARSSTM